MSGFLFFVTITILWQVLSYFHFLPQNKFSSPLSIAIALKELFIIGLPPGHKLTIHTLYSLYRVFVGYFSAVIFAIPLGLLMGWIPSFRRIMYPLIESLRHIPPLAWIPLSILWFGIGIKSAGFIIFLGAFFPILLNSISGAMLIDPIYRDVGITLGFKRHHLFFKVLIPGALPHIFTGLRIGMGIAWMTLVAAEFTGVKQGYGLGYMIMVARDIQRVDEIMAGMVVIGTIGIIIDWAFKTVKNKMFPWISS